MRLHVLNAAEGDCLLLDSGGDPPRYALVDGGPAGTWERRARRYILDVLGDPPVLDLVVVSHVDADHIVGVLDMLAEIEAERWEEGSNAIRVRELWHNGFSDALDTPARSISQGIQAVLDVAGAVQRPMALGQVVFYGIAQGAQLERSARRIDIPVNASFGGGLISPDTTGAGALALGDLSIRVIGPLDSNLRDLQGEWLDWLRRNGMALAENGEEALANLDRSIPNLSSIVLLVEAAGRRLLLTGDARGDHIAEGLEAAGILDDEGRTHFELLKVQHHGSDRNATRDFYRSITADRYVISANGRHGNPDLDTLRWIADAAVEGGRSIEIYLTNELPVLEEFRAGLAGDGCRLIVGADPAFVIDLD